MRNTSRLDTVNIRPGVSILSLLQHLNYRPWYALAEFVDNALQSFLTHRAEIRTIDAVLKVDIEFDPTDRGRLVVRDNAAGIYESEYARAFRPAEIPPDRSGLGEFGMGMKSAACWFAGKWSVRTSALGEPLERTINFDINRIVEDKIEELEITSRRVPAEMHYTEIALNELHHPLQTRTVGKIKEHLAGIYRVFLRQGILRLTFNDEELQYGEPPILSAPHHRTPSAPPILWRKEINFDFGEGQRASGFAALRQTGSTSTAGFALFRRNRLIQGSGDETYRPQFIFGHTNSFRYQRLFGELHLEGFDISHTKDGFRWEEHEQPFLELLKEYLDNEPVRLLEQADYYRVRASRNELMQSAETATERTAECIERDVPPVLSAQLTAEPDGAPPAAQLPRTTPPTSVRQINVELNQQPWQIVVEVVTDPAVGDWITISDSPDFVDPELHIPRRRVCVRMCLAHPFMDHFCGSDAGTMEALLRVAAGLGLAYIAARDAGAMLISTMIRNLNDLLRNGLSNP
ncbi:MAG: ATP-binding protein [Ignavibacteria bacterium]|nr:ATP-binding protein [Ignavibacteria bacterium]